MGRVLLCHYGHVVHLFCNSFNEESNEYCYLSIQYLSKTNVFSPLQNVM